MNWYYTSNGDRVGPVTSNEFSQAIANKTIDDQSLIWHDGMTDWKPFRTLKASPELLGESDQAFCVVSGKLHPKAEMAKIGQSYVSASHKDEFMQRLQEGGISETAALGEFEYAGFWIRFVAKIVDSIILYVINTIVIAVLAAIGFGLGDGFIDPETGELGAAYFIFVFGTYLLGFLIGASYNAIFLPKYGATPGKMITGLKVVRTDGSHISFGQSVGRVLAEYLSGMILGIGYIMAAFDDEKRSLHDRMCNTRVIKK